MDGIESFHCPLCKCKTTVDFTAHLVEKDATIAALTIEVDRLTGYSERLNGLRERLEDSKATLTAELDAALATIAALRVAAGAVCGFPSPKAWERLEEVLERCSPTKK